MKEIELKVFIGPVSIERPAAITTLKVKRSSMEEDVYYTSRYKDLIETEECLRIRTRDGSSELTWKPPTTQEMLEKKQYWKQELNVDIGDQAAAMREMLERLEFVEYVVVRKERVEYIYDDETTITVDKIEGIGLFAEIETMCADTVYGTEKNSQVLKELGLGAMVRVQRPYRDIVKDGQVNA